MRGCTFAVWAPNARRVSVVGDFNRWDGRALSRCANSLGSGVWEIFLPGVEEGTHYKFEVLGPHGGIQLKSDPFAFYNQHGIQTSSLVWDLGRYAWSDNEWMRSRREKNWQHQPVSVYEVHLGSWQRKPEEGDRRAQSYRELADDPVGLRHRNGVHPHRIDGRSPNIPFDGELGLPDHGLFRAHQPFRQPGRIPLLRGPLPPARHRRHSGLGAGPFSQGCARPSGVRRHRSL